LRHARADQAAGHEGDEWSAENLFLPGHAALLCVKDLPMQRLYHPN